MTIDLATPSLRPIPVPGPRLLAAWILAVIAPTAITAGLTPLRHSLGLTGALLSDLLAVVGVALLGGVLPALLATTVAILLSDYLFTAPLHTLRVTNWIDLIALITFGMVALAVGGLVDLLTRQGLRAAHEHAETHNLARLAADAIAHPRDFTGIVGSIRRAFDLDAVAVLRHTNTGWEVEASTCPDRLQQPDQADYQVQITSARILAITNTPHPTHDTARLQAFLTELRLARERALLETR